MDLDLSNLCLYWVSILDVSNFGCGTKSKEDLNGGKRKLTGDLEIPLDFACVRLGFL